MKSASLTCSWYSTSNNVPELVLYIGETFNLIWIISINSQYMHHLFYIYLININIWFFLVSTFNFTAQKKYLQTFMLPLGFFVKTLTICLLDIDEKADSEFTEFHLMTLESISQKVKIIIVLRKRVKGTFKYSFSDKSCPKVKAGHTF